MSLSASFEQQILNTMEAKAVTEVGNMDPQTQTPPPASQVIHAGTDHASTAFEDSGYFDDDQIFPPRKDSKDFILFDTRHAAFSDDSNLPSHSDLLNHGHLSTDPYLDMDYFVDVNQDFVNAHFGSLPQVGYDATTHQDIALPIREFYDPVRDSVPQSVNGDNLAALSFNYDQQVHHEISLRPPPTPYLQPVELWSDTPHRHEAIAYRLERPRSQAREHIPNEHRS